MTMSVIAPMIGMVFGIMIYIAASWALRRSRVFDALDVGLGGIAVAAFIGGFVGYKIFELVGVTVG